MYLDIVIKGEVSRFGGAGGYIPSSQCSANIDKSIRSTFLSRLISPTGYIFNAV